MVERSTQAGTLVVSGNDDAIARHQSSDQPRKSAWDNSEKVSRGPHSGPMHTVLYIVVFAQQCRIIQLHSRRGGDCVKILKNRGGRARFLAFLLFGGQRTASESASGSQT